MAVLLGSDGGIQFDLGDGLLCTANVFSWNARLSHETLRTTRQGDEAERRTAGLADWTGSVSLRLEFSDDESQANSAWQILSFATNGTDDELKAGVKLFLQRFEPPEICDNVFATRIEGEIWLEGTVVLKDISLNCEDPGQPIVAVVDWEADGALTLERENPAPP